MKIHNRKRTFNNNKLEGKMSARLILFLITSAYALGDKSLRRMDLLFYEESFHVIHVEHDLLTLAASCEDLKRKASHLSKVVSPLNLRAAYGEETAKAAIAEELKDFVDIIAEKLVGITGNAESMSKRAIEFLGDLWHSISGAPGPKQFRNQIDAENRMNEALRLQVSENEKTNEKFRLYAKIMKIQKVEAKLINQSVKNLQVKSGMYEDVSIFRANFMKQGRRLRCNLDTIESIIDNGKQNLISPDLIERNEFIEIIRKIRQENPVLSPIFSEDEVHLYYGLKIARVVYHDNKIHAFVRIPLVNFANPMTIRPIQRSKHGQISYLLTSKDETKYAMMEQNELQKALNKGKFYITELRRIEIHLSNLTCSKVGCVTPNDGIEISQIDRHTFTFILNETMSAAVNCLNASHSANGVKLPRNGFATIPEDCSLATKAFKIHKFSEHGTTFLKHEEPDFEVQEFQIHTRNEMSEKIMKELERSEEALKGSLEEIGKDSEIKIAKQKKLIQEAQAQINAATYAGGISLAVIIAILVATIIAVVVLWGTMQRYHN